MARVRQAFTLVEILVVVVILGILASVVAGQFVSVTDEAKRGAFVAELKIFSDAANLYFAREGSFLEDSSSGEMPRGFEAYTDADEWTNGTPIGGVWDAELNSFEITSGLGVHFNGGVRRDDAYMTLVDQAFDDGSVESGLFRRIAAGRYYYIIEE